MNSPTRHESILIAWLQDYRGILLKLARSFASEPEDQNDLFQQMAVQLWQSVPRFRSEAKPTTWIYRVCLNTALNWRRTESKRKGSVRLDSVPELAGGVADGSRANDAGELLDALYREVRALPPAERSLVILHLDGLTYREIGEIMGTSENQVGISLTRIRKKMAEALKEIRNEL
ncbi:MAG: sigma-70 family RNA polymerase sigma factor [Opitutaceae bacterium]|jgi:RNA polymerase sigma-70 factor (ECF subfamily)